MFTGLIEEVGAVERIQRSGRLQLMRVNCAFAEDGVQVGDSINIDGACQTVVECDSRGFSVESVDETLSRTTLGTLAPGGSVNLERSLKAGDRLDGHLIMGHIDAVATIARRKDRSDSTLFGVTIPEGLNSQIAPKGSVALDGISLTVVDVLDDSFTIAAIPHTLAVTTWGAKPVGASVNLETDVLAKYVARALGGATQQSNITQRWLNDAGIV